jgi:hypothetical protein
MDETEMYLYRKRLALDFGLFAAEQHNARTTDPETSHKADRANAPRRASQATRILRAYLDGPQTDEQASEIAGVPNGWKRCSDLRRLGYIIPTGETAVTSYGVEANVCRITDLGREVARGR